MGLCKCPKRQVTNQFCFEHRVNVCENCMVQSHSKCIVQSYLQWLRDSDYVSNCTLCSTSLEQGECVRLICYHVFHWDCLNARQSSLPANTAPRGHQCPICETEILPTTNLVSPVADELKVYLQKANWARNGLNLAQLSDGDNSPLRSTKVSNLSSQSTVNNAFNSVTKVHHAGVERQKEHNDDIFSSTTLKQNSPHSVLLMDAFTPPSNNEIHASSRRSLLPRQAPIGGSGDRDDNKYKRRTPAEIFSRWSRRFYAPSSRPPWRRTWFIAVSGILIFFLIIYLMASFGRSGLNESLDDSWNNPNPNPNVNPHYE